MDATITDPDSPPSFNDFALSGKIMLSAIIVLLFVVILIVCLHLYARWYILRARRRGINGRHRQNRLVFYFENTAPHNNPSISTQQRGLDPSILKSLPVFIFSSSTNPHPIDCAVCLSEFEENEPGRILPKCSHSFHTDCIDMWFHSHSTCPLCRSPVEPVLDCPVEPERTEPGLASSSAAGSSSFRARRKPVELAGVSIEIPRRGDGEDGANSSLTPLTPSFKSPISRVMSLSFKRIVGKDRRGGLSPSGHVGGCSSEPDPEWGKDNVV